MCFSGSLPSKALLCCVPATCSSVWWMMFTIIGVGSPISPNKPGTAPKPCATFQKRWVWKQHWLCVQGHTDGGRVVAQRQASDTISPWQIKSENISSLFWFLLSFSLGFSPTWPFYTKSVVRLGFETSFIVLEAFLSFVLYSFQMSLKTNQLLTFWG